MASGKRKTIDLELNKN